MGGSVMFPRFDRARRDAMFQAVRSVRNIEEASLSPNERLEKVEMLRQLAVVARSNVVSGSGTDEDPAYWLALKRRLAP
jgi:hypothetical protein